MAVAKIGITATLKRFKRTIVRSSDLILPYVVFSLLWIAFSDYLLMLFFDDPQELTLAQTIKGWGFVALSAGLFAVLSLARRRAEQQTAQALQSSERAFRLMFMDNPQPMWLYDTASLAMLEVNQAAIAEYGYRREEFLSLNLRDVLIIPPNMPSDTHNILEHDVLDDARLEPNPNTSATPATYFATTRLQQHRHHNGHSLNVDVRSHDTDFHGRPAVLVVATNISARLRAEKVAQNLDLALTKRLEHLSTLHAIDKVITQGHSVQATLQQVLATVLYALELEAACVFIYYSDSEQLRCEARLGFGHAVRQCGTSTAPDSLVQHVAQQRQRLVCSDPHNLAPLFPAEPALVQEGFRCYYALPLIARNRLQGVLELFSRREAKPEHGWFEFLDMLAPQIAIAIENSMFFQQLKDSHEQLQQAYDATIQGWSTALDLRDNDTEGHSLRVTHLALELAQRMGIDKTTCVHIRRGALLHDIGKMGVPDSILHKPAALSEDEWQVMRQHPIYAYNFLSPITFLAPALDIPYAHHERWDGSGYPLGLRGEAIPLAARIFAVVDVYDALSNDRPYRRALPRDEVLRYIESQTGKHFDPNVVAHFLDMQSQSTPHTGGTTAAKHGHSDYKEHNNKPYRS